MTTQSGENVKRIGPHFNIIAVVQTKTQIRNCVNDATRTGRRAGELVLVRPGGDVLVQLRPAGYRTVAGGTLYDARHLPRAAAKGVQQAQAQLRGAQVAVAIGVQAAAECIWTLAGC